MEMHMKGMTIGIGLIHEFTEDLYSQYGTIGFDTAVTIGQKNLHIVAGQVNIKDRVISICILNIEFYFFWGLT